jgi:hypothetical protein
MKIKKASAEETVTQHNYHKLNGIHNYATMSYTTMSYTTMLRCPALLSSKTFDLLQAQTLRDRTGASLHKNEQKIEQRLWQNVHVFIDY